MGGHKKHKKNKKEKKKKSKRRSSSSVNESSSEDDVWVEKGSGKEKHSPQQQLERDDWLSQSDDLFATVSREQLKPKTEKKKEERVSIDEMGQSSRELNPYWKDGGTGLPEESTADRNKPSGTVGDLGLSWLCRALDRAKQTAEEEKRPLEEVVAPVWGSLDKLLDLIKEAEEENRANKRHNNPNSSKFYRDQSGKDDRRFYKPYHNDKDDRRSDERHRKDDGKPRGFRKPFENSDDSRGRRHDEDRRRHHDGSRGFRKPQDDDTNERLEKLRRSSASSQRSHWKKPSSAEPTSSKESEPRKTDEMPSPKPMEKQVKASSPNPDPVIMEKPEIITQDEMNKIAAEIFRAELMGNEDQVKSLKEKLKKSQAWLGSGSKSQSKEQKEVVLIQTDRYGFTRPVTSSTSSQPQSSKKRVKVETHSDGKRVRYFKDDDKYSLQDLVHQEKFVSVSDQNEMYVKLAKGVGQKADDDDFEEGGGSEKTEEWSDFSRRQRAALESTQREKVLDSCRFCLDSHAANRRLVISLMDKVYLSVPPYQSLTDGHCLIMPIQHTPCSTLLDEDVWEEVMDLRRLVVKMFLEDEKDVIFYESAKNLKKFPHMVLNCVPVPKEIGDDAPIYFKKALLECEMEWSNNKKVVDLKGRDVRKAVPKGLSYFSVDFGLQSGYAHVIEDERLFPKNFAEEIIGGMMDLDHSIWRKQKKDDQEVQMAKTQQFIRKFKEFTSKKQL